MGIQIHKHLRNKDQFILSIDWDDELNHCNLTKDGIELSLSDNTLTAIKTALLVKETYGQCT